MVHRNRKLQLLVCNPPNPTYGIRKAIIYLKKKVFTARTSSIILTSGFVRQCCRWRQHGRPRFGERCVGGPRGGTFWASADETWQAANIRNPARTHRRKHSTLFWTARWGVCWSAVKVRLENINAARLFLPLSYIRTDSCCTRHRCLHRLCVSPEPRV